jgi:hypothetical protein
MRRAKKGENMAIDKPKGDFLDFIIEASGSESLATAFLKIEKAEKLQEFFQHNGWDDISRKDCKGILKAATSGHGKGINKDGEPVIFDRSGTKSY